MDHRFVSIDDSCLEIACTLRQATKLMLKVDVLFPRSSFAASLVAAIGPKGSVPTHQHVHTLHFQVDGRHHDSTSFVHVVPMLLDWFV
jgi:hypothetical protein